MAVHTWADGLGLWHASVPASGRRAKDAGVARAAIVEELAQRNGPNFDPRSVHITRTAVTNHGTVKYSEA